MQIKGEPTTQVRAYKRDIPRLRKLAYEYEKVLNQRFTQGDVISILLDKAFDGANYESNNGTDR